MKAAITLIFFIAFSAAGLAAVFVLTGFNTGLLMWSMLGITVLFIALGTVGVRRVKAQEREASHD